MCGANCSLIRFHERSSVKMKTMFGRDESDCRVADELDLLHALKVSRTATATMITPRTLSQRVGVTRSPVFALWAAR